MEITLKDFEDLAVLTAACSFTGALLGVLVYQFFSWLFSYLADFLPVPNASIVKLTNENRALKSENFSLSQEIIVLKADAYFDNFDKVNP